MSVWRESSLLVFLSVRGLSYDGFIVVTCDLVRLGLGRCLDSGEGQYRWGWVRGDSLPRIINHFYDNERKAGGGGGERGEVGELAALAVVPAARQVGGNLPLVARESKLFVAPVWGQRMVGVGVITILGAGLACEFWAGGGGLSIFSFRWVGRLANPCVGRAGSPCSCASASPSIPWRGTWPR